MLKTKITLWLFLLSTLFLFLLMPIYGGKLIEIYKYFLWAVVYVMLFWFILFLSLGSSFGIYIKAFDKNHYHTLSYLKTVYWLLTKEARAVANDYYQFNPNKGVAK